MIGIIQKTFIGLTGIIYGSNHTKCISFSNHKCMIQPSLVNLHSRISRRKNFTTISLRLN